MYALPNKTQHKLIAKVRGGISQLDNFTTASSATASSATSASSSTSSFGNKTNLSAPLLTGASPFSAVSSLKESAFNKHVGEAGFEAELGKLPQPIFHSTQKGGKQKLSSSLTKAQKQYITPEHNEMIKYVQQSWKGVERDYKKSVNKYINKLDINSPSDSQSHLKKVTKKNTTGSSPLLLSGSYHHTSRASTSGGSNKQDSFRPFDLEAFWGNRILKRLTEEL